MRRSLLLNALGFQLCWLAWVAGAGQGSLLPGLLATLLFAAWQLAVSAHRQADLVLLVLGVAAGLALDGTLASLGLIEYRLPGPLPAPWWILGLWACFALTLNHSLAFLAGRPRLAALLGGLGAPLAYLFAAHTWKAAKLGPDPMLALAVLGVAWAVLAPLLAECAARLRRSSGASLEVLR